ncbi:MAG: DJ-1/PfpI family protein [Bacteroidota bacterium]
MPQFLQPTVWILLMITLWLLNHSCAPAEVQSSTTTQLDEEIGLPALRPIPNFDSSRYNVAFLIMDGVYNTELTAPYDIFQHTIFREGIRAMNVFTVAKTREPVTTFEGMRILPDLGYLTDSLPNIDILVVPSAEHHLDTDLKDEEMLEFVRKVDKNVSFITSHCDGAFVLAKAGLLEGHISTTFPSDIDQMREMFPQLDVRKNLLFVHDGKYITSAGGAKSFEAALYLAEHLYGDSIARSLAGGLVIDWKLEEVPHLVID